MGENNELKSRYLHIDENVVKRIKELEQNKNVDIQDKNVDIQDKNVDIQDKNVDIQDKNVDIENFAEKTQSNISKLYKEFGNTKIFGRSEAEKILGLKPARVSLLLKDMLTKNIIEPVKGHGKGKYRFRGEYTPKK